MTEEPDIMSSPEATVEIVRCADEDCRYELTESDEVLLAEAREEDPDLTWWECPGCGRVGVGVEDAAMTMRQRIDQWNDSMDELIDAFNMIGERVPSMRPRIEREVDATRKILKALMPFIESDLGPHVQITVGRDGTAEWLVVR